MTGLKVIADHLLAVALKTLDIFESCFIFKYSVCVSSFTAAIYYRCEIF